MFDAHRHPDGAASAAAARAAGVQGAVVAGLGPADWEGLRASAPQDGGWLAGLHPWWVDTAPAPALRAALDALADVLASGDPIGVGECGLDHARARTPAARARQLEALGAQLGLARAHALPVVLHVVRATGAAQQRVATARLPRGGLVHGFAGPREVAEGWRRLGFVLGIGPAVFRSARLRATLPHLPARCLVVETDDAPGGDTLGRVIAALAALRGEDPADTARYTAANARRVFGLPGGSA